MPLLQRTAHNKKKATTQRTVLWLVLRIAFYETDQPAIAFFLRKERIFSPSTKKAPMAQGKSMVSAR